MPAKRTQTRRGTGHDAQTPPPHSGAATRATFLRYFEERGHHVMPSSSLVPSNDPTVLLTTAGVQQVIPYFLGQQEPPARRLASAQKSFRTTDIDEVGDDSHLTFFEMLGNFSVGDYLKRDAIAFAWELLVSVYGIPAARLFPTVHPDDDAAAHYWQEVTGIPAERVTRLADNWWGPPGDSGPCGPDSEIYYDRGPEHGCGEADCAPGCVRCQRYLETWNLVFTEYYQDTGGHRTLLKQPNIDTGMGLERLSMVLQGKESVFETDLFRPILDRFAALASTRYGADPAHDRSLRVIADHGRALVFLAADGVRPSNVGRGHIFRRVLRRAVRHGKLLGLEGPFLAEAADTVIALLGGHYHELVSRRDAIIEVLTVEERRFSQTLAAGLEILARRLDELERTGAREVPGELAFRLYDTHGFPLELTDEVARERGFTVDRVGYEGAMARQQETARQVSAFVRNQEEEAWTRISTELPATTFSGYEGTTGASAIMAVLAVSDQNGRNERTDAISAPQRAAIVLAATPFYAEAGGQVGDSGEISGETGSFRVLDTQRPVPGLIVHYGEMIEGHLRVGSAVRAVVDSARRAATMRNHSATHLLHRALREMLGDQVEQRGSLVAPDRLRFDFSLGRALTAAEIRAIDRRVNDLVLADLPVTTAILPYKDALQTGAMALFSEKYGAMVRVVTMGPSRELCGGTHVAATGQIGVYLTTQEGSTGTGIRRVEALTGTGAASYLRDRSDLVAILAGRLQARPEEIAERVRQLQEELAATRRALAGVQRAHLRDEAARLAGERRDVSGIPVVAAEVPAADDQALREMGDVVRSRLGSGVIVLAARLDGRVSFLVTADAALTARGIHAGRIAEGLGHALGGRGGGRADRAQGGSKEPRQLETALARLPDLLTAQVS